MKIEKRIKKLHWECVVPFWRSAARRVKAFPSESFPPPGDALSDTKLWWLYKMLQGSNFFQDNGKRKFFYLF